MGSTTILKKEMLPKMVDFNGTSIPVIHNGEIRRISDIHYGNEDFVYLKDNEGIPVRIEDLEIKESWIPLVKAYKKREEDRVSELLGKEKMNWRKYNSLLIDLSKLERKFFKGQ